MQGEGDLGGRENVQWVGCCGNNGLGRVVAGS